MGCLADGTPVCRRCHYPVKPGVESREVCGCETPSVDNEACKRCDLGSNCPKVSSRGVCSHMSAMELLEHPPAEELDRNEHLKAEALKPYGRAPKAPSAPPPRAVWADRRSFVPTPAPADLYASLRSVLADAITHASEGKGMERHANPGESFDEQKTVQLNEKIGSNHGAIFQAAKKATESARLEYPAARHELLGAINYLAAAVIVLDRQAAREASS